MLRILERPPIVQGVIAGGLLLVASLCGSWTCYTTAYRAFRVTVDEDLLTIARIASLRIDPEEHARLTRPEQQNGPEYLRVVAPLREIAAIRDDLQYIYTLRPSPEGLRFVVDTGFPEDADGDRRIDQAGLGQLYDNPPAGLIATVRDGLTHISDDLYTDSWGTFFSAWVPIRHLDGRLECVLAVDLSGRSYIERLNQIRKSLLLGCVASLAVSLIAGTCVTIYQRTKRDYITRLAQSEQRYALAVEGSRDGLWDWDMRTHAFYGSEHLRRMLGIRPPELERIGWIEEFSRRLHPEDRTRVRRAISEHLRSRAPFDVECRLRAADGQYHWYQARGQAVWDERGRPIRFVGSIGDVTERVRLRRQLRRAARLDRLTRLPNRSALLNRLRRLIRDRRERPGPLFALLFLDFDRFKIVNDSLGHEAGDAMLVEVASRLRKNLRRGDQIIPFARGTAARIGGDEFVVLLDGLRTPQDAVTLARRLLEDLSEPYELNPYHVSSSASIGIAIGHDSYERAEDLLRDADTAMYEAKTFSRGSLVVFDESMRRRIRRRMQVEQGLRDAIRDDNLFLLFQPIVCLRTGRVVSVEALVRWEHPELGRMMPEEFIPIAEECGLIVPLGERVLEQGFQCLARWSAGDDSPTSGISLNLARNHLMMPDLPRLLEAEAHRAGISPSDVHLEITEGAVMPDVAAARERLGQLRKVGFRLAIDDFGTGYSSLACLHQFPFDLLKIDRLFLEGLGFSPDRVAIVRAITTLADILGFRVVAEGIETPDQLALLRELGCDYGQGYYFSRPVPIDEIPAFLPLPSPSDVGVDLRC
ncbi:putative bifunctional diguanylate cyclase/phosphodiesterase [Tautonia sociabilis]|nr:bifunctional diguanylate cyclase/phosphodiesterase [Tautonia sociabilis]